MHESPCSPNGRHDHCGTRRRSGIPSVIHAVTFWALAQGSFLPFVEFTIPFVDGEALKTKSDVVSCWRQGEPKAAGTWIA